jgi:phosphomethylpyrimidine synthase
MNQLLAAWQGTVTPEMEQVAREEGRPVEQILQGVAAGSIVIPVNLRRRENRKAVGIGAGLRTKVNANIGTSPHQTALDDHLAKLRAALDAGADAVMDLSTGGDLDRYRREVLAGCPVPVGTVPIYQAAVEARERHGTIVKMTVDEMFAVVERQARDGVDFFTIHAGVTLASLARLRKQGRVTDIISRGGSFLTGWMLHNGQENPFYEHFDRLLEICLAHDVTLSLGDGMRPGCTADATDRTQVEELLILGELVDRCRETGVQVFVEGPGHVPLDQVIMNVQLQKRVCRGAPFYVLGPLVTDVAPGYDHITAAIGGAVAAMAGADFLCYVTPAEHLGLPTVEDVREGVMATRVAGHAADLVKNVPGARDWDAEMSRARKSLDWERQLELAIDPEKARRYYEERNPGQKVAGCTMCGEYCAMKLVGEYLGGVDRRSC